MISLQKRRDIRWGYYRNVSSGVSPQTLGERPVAQKSRKNTKAVGTSKGRKLYLVDRPITSLKPNPRNAREHSSKQVMQIAASMKEFGATNPILIDEDNVIIAGHGRLEAAKALKLKCFPTIRISHLTEDQKRALAIADNKLTANAA